LGGLASVLEAAALPVAVSAAFAAAPPLWFCIMCPAVLGLLTPLIINIALNQVDEAVSLSPAFPTTS
jgi:hypothetical protein